MVPSWGAVVGEGESIVIWRLEAYELEASKRVGFPSEGGVGEGVSEEGRFDDAAPSLDEEPASRGCVSGPAPAS